MKEFVNSLDRTDENKGAKT